MTDLARQTERRPSSAAIGRGVWLRPCAASLLMAAGLIGCGAQGPRTVERDQLAYAEAIAGTMERQALRTMVQLRYLDWPVLLQTGQVVAGYTWEGGAKVSSGVKSPFQPGVGLGDINGELSGKWIERPTITYQPVVGDEFVKQLLTPIRPDLLFALVESGISAELLMYMTVESVNGQRNGTALAEAPAHVDEGFQRFAVLLGDLQAMNAVQLRRKPGESASETAMLQLVLARQGLPPELQEELRQVKRLLGLQPDAPAYDIAYGIAPESETQIVLKTRPTWRILAELGSSIDVPAEHQNRARPTRRLPTDLGVRFKIHCSKAPPTDAAVAARYRARWFWIDDRDIASKQTLDLVLVLLTVAETKDDRRAPLITIPAG